MSGAIELLVATRNRKKLREIRELLSDTDWRITSLEDYRDLPRIVEDGQTFAQNAIKKAATIAQYTKKLVMGEDSGLEVEALGNRPGVYSARYAGEGATDRKNNLKLLRELRGVPFKKRRARYRCAVALADARGLIGMVTGNCRGFIGFKPKGTHGFGYDPLFVVEPDGKTFAELGPEIKHKMSHRSRALKKALRIMEEYVKRGRLISS